MEKLLVQHLHIQSVNVCYPESTNCEFKINWVKSPSKMLMRALLIRHFCDLSKLTIPFLRVHFRYCCLLTKIRNLKWWEPNHQELFAVPICSIQVIKLLSFHLPFCLRHSWNFVAAWGWGLSGNTDFTLCYEKVLLSLCCHFCLLY